MGLKQAISKQVDIKLKLEQFFPDMVGGKLSLSRFERLLKQYEESSVQVGIEKQKLKAQLKN